MVLWSPFSEAWFPERLDPIHTPRCGRFLGARRFGSSFPYRRGIGGWGCRYSGSLASEMDGEAVLAAALAGATADLMNPGATVAERGK